MTYQQAHWEARLRDIRNMLANFIRLANNPNGPGLADEDRAYLQNVVILLGAIAGRLL